MNARYPYLFALALTLPLASCRFVGMKPDFSVMGDALSPAETDSVYVESKPAGSTPLTSYTRPAPHPTALPRSSAEPTLFSQQQMQAPAQNPPPARASVASQVQPPLSTANPSAAATAQGVYTVQPGDSLSRIARLHKVPLGSLAAANGIDLQQPLIKPGQQLRIPQGGAAIIAPPRSATLPSPAAPAVPATPAAAATPAPTTPATPAPAAPTLVLKPVATATPVPPPAPASTTSPAAAAAPASSAATPTLPKGQYRVCAGDTLYRIARQHGISLQQLMQANNLTEESARSVRVGTILTIPTQP